MVLGLVYIRSSAMWHCQYYNLILSFSLQLFFSILSKSDPLQRIFPANCVQGIIPLSRQSCRVRGLIYSRSIPLLSVRKSLPAKSRLRICVTSTIRFSTPLNAEATSYISYVSMSKCRVMNTSRTSPPLNDISRTMRSMSHSCENLSGILDSAIYFLSSMWAYAEHSPNHFKIIMFLTV